MVKVYCPECHELVMEYAPCKSIRIRGGKIKCVWCNYVFLPDYKIG